MITVDFATFCYAGDAHRLHRPGHLEMMVSSNKYPFNEVLVVYQLCDPNTYQWPICHFNARQVPIRNIDNVLRNSGIDLDKPQYTSDVDRHHTWKQHVANHLMAANTTEAEYIVFADSDCWMIRQPAGHSWVDIGIEILQTQPDVFIVSPNDGEPERKTQVISQQMFLTRVSDFRNADFNQPGYSGNPRDYPEMPEYAAMLEGRISFHCKATGRYRYVLPAEYRYFHHNRFNEDGTYKTNYGDYGIVI